MEIIVEFTSSSAQSEVVETAEELIQLVERFHDPIIRLYCAGVYPLIIDSSIASVFGALEGLHVAGKACAPYLLFFFAPLDKPLQRFSSAC
jgi:hypothetical protein